MPGLIQKSKNLVWYCILPFGLFVLFKNAIDKLLGSLLVQPILSNISPPNIAYDLASLIILLSVAIPIIVKISRGTSIPVKWYYLGFTYLIIYIIYRSSGIPFHFTSISFVSSIKLMDLFSFMPMLILILSIAFMKKEQPIQGNENGFITDEATVMTKDTDLLNRSKFVEEFVSKIRDTSSPNGSFPIGVVASWGSGKTTFLNTLKSKLNNSSVISFEFNAWKCGNPNQIIETFFTLLKEQLKKYSFTIDNSLANYSNNLLKGMKGDAFNGIRTISETVFKNPSIEKQYDKVNEEIKKINKKVIILIDDLDRLDKREIYEVIRLIRNTANFANTFFIVAYDRNYILNAIQEINPYHSHVFLEKIFQLEFTLPPISQKIIRAELIKRIKTVLTEKGKEGFNYLMDEGNRFYEYANGDLTRLFIHNMRDVVRFINSFKLNYEFVKDEIYLPDFYNLELIRFKNPDLFLAIYKDWHCLFTTDSDQNNTAQSNLYSCSLKTIDRNGQKVIIPVLRDFILKQNEIYKLDEQEIDTICEAYQIMFPAPNFRLSARTKGGDGHLTVLKPSMLDRYFTLGIDGRLSEIEFSKMRNLPEADFKARLRELAKNEDLIEDISARFETKEEFDSKEDFEKVVRCIFYFSNLPSPDKRRRAFHDCIRFDSKSLSKIIGDKNILNKFYGGNKNLYMKFLESLIITDSIKYTYTNDFVRDLLYEAYYFIGEIINGDEIAKILLLNFKNAIEKSQSFTPDIWNFYMSAECRTEIPVGNGTTQISRIRNIEAMKMMRRFIFDHGMDDFMAFSIREVPFDKTFVIGDAIKLVFKENKYFILLLKICKKELKYKEEFISFYEQLLKDDEAQSARPIGLPLEFFKAIPVRQKYR